VLLREGDAIVESLLDSDGNGRADQREIYRGGKRVRVELDTNGSGRPDVVQHLEGENVVRQEEDSDHDGRLDRAFEGQKPVPMANEAKAPPPLPKLDCGRFDVFWKNH